MQSIMRPPYTCDVYGAYAQLRGAAPLFRSDDGLWLASTYDLATTVFRTPSLGQGRGPDSRLRSDPRYGHSPALQTLSYMLSFIDPPDHTRLRKLIARAFTPPAVERMRAYLGGLANRLLDPIEANG